MDSHAPTQLDSKVSQRELLERAVHDLRNPLAVVRASLEWLEVELAGREDALDAVRDASGAGARLMTIVDDLDALARLEARGAVPQDPSAVVPLVESAVSTANAWLIPRGISVVAIGADENAFVTVETPDDARLLGRAISASVEATARGASPGACIEVEVRSPPRGDRVEIGIALRGAEAPEVGEPSADGLSSSGLGVYVAARVVEAHGGTLDVVPTTMLPRIIIRLPRSGSA